MDKIDVNFRWQNGELARLKAAPSVIARAMKLAIASVTQWGRIQVQRRVSKATGIQLRVIQGRIHVTIRDNFGWIWVGLNRISARRLNPKEVDGGVEAAGRFFDNAFIVKGDGPLAGQVMVRKGPARLPIEKQYVEIDKEAEPVVREIANEINARLNKELSRQISLLTA